MMPMGYGWPGWCGWGWGLGMLFMLLFWVLIIVGVVLLVRWVWERSRKEQRPSPDESAMDILKRRYAGGEIGREEFDRMKADLKMRNSLQELERYDQR